MKAQDIIRYCHELGWHDPPELAQPLPADASASAARSTTAETGAGPTAGAPQGSIAGCRSLDELARLIDGCTRCRLAQRRRRIVFGEGHPQASLMFVGEAPGADEDRTGRPFVGQAGKLLDAMIFALGLTRHDVFITNVVKCRPPGNRDPQEEEKAACAAVLDRQIELIQPKILVALGKPAAHRLLGTTKPISALRGRWGAYHGIPLLPTFHPAYLLRSPGDKHLVWQDLKQILARL